MVHVCADVLRLSLVWGAMVFWRGKGVRMQEDEGGTGGVCGVWGAGGVEFDGVMQSFVDFFIRSTFYAEIFSLSL